MDDAELADFLAMYEQACADAGVAPLAENDLVVIAAG
jgi:hypothetical protein